MTDENINQAKGRVKEAAGALSGDRGLNYEGHADPRRVSASCSVRFARQSACTASTLLGFSG